MSLRRAVIEIELLFDDEIENPLPYDSLERIWESMTTGHVSGQWTIKKDEVVGRRRMANLLRKQHSDPSFLLGDEEE